MPSENHCQERGLQIAFFHSSVFCPNCVGAGLGGMTDKLARLASQALSTASLGQGVAALEHQQVKQEPPEERAHMQAQLEDSCCKIHATLCNTPSFSFGTSFDYLRSSGGLVANDRKLVSHKIASLTIGVWVISI